ncbi:MAG: hypothetical protein RL441_1073, partial [Actinomycetota bacterium]
MSELIRGLAGAFALGGRFAVGSIVRAARMLGVTVSLVAVVFSAAAAYTSMIAYHQKVETSDARTPWSRFTNEGKLKGPPSFRVAYRDDRLSDDLSYSMMVLKPLKPTPPPPGLERWPERGEVFLSPALWHDGIAQGIESRYGTFAGLISEEGLSAPDERFAYIGYSPGLVPESSLMPAQVFGTAYPHDWWSMSLPWNSETAYIFQFPIFFGALLALVILPSLSLLLAARRFDADARAARNLLLKSLGAGRTHRLAAAIGEHRHALAAALLFLAAINLMVLTRPVVLPIVDFELPRLAMTSHRMTLVALQIVTFAVVSLILLEVSNGWRGKAASKRQRRSLLPIWVRLRGVGVFVTFCIAALWVPYVLDSKVGRTWQTTFLLLSVGAIATLPSALRELLPALGAVISRIGRVRNRFPLFLSGRLLAVSSRSLAPVATLMVVSTGVLFQVLFMLNSFSTQAQNAVRIADAAAGHLVVADFDRGVGNLEAILADLPAGVDTAIFEVDGQSNAALIGSSASITALGARCGVIPQLEPDSLLDFATSDVWVEELGATSCVQQLVPGDGRSFQRLILFSESALPATEVRGALLRHSLPNTPMSSPLYGFVSSGLASAHQGQWLVLEGLIGSFLLLVVLLLGLIDRARDQATRLAQVLAVGGDSSLLHTVGAITIGLPIVVSGLSGALLSWCLTRLPISIHLAPEFGTDLVVAMVLVVVVMAVV